MRASRESGLNGAARRTIVVTLVLLMCLVGVSPARAATVVSDPNHHWVLVNKTHPLNPLRYVPPDRVNWAGTGHWMRRDVASAVTRLFSGARSAGHSLGVVSAYRSYDEQAALYNHYVRTYGQAEADRISARPGHSEHQTGLAVDVGNAAGGCELAGCFGDTPGGRWVAANAHRYGFIVRYPKGYTHITGYTYEPWHLRYVGVALATDMRNRGIPTMEQYFSGPSIPSAADVLAADSAGVLWNYPGNQRGSFSPRFRLGSGWGQLKSGFTADWNADGIKDVVAQWKSGALTVYRGRASGGFLSPITVGRAGWESMTITVGKWHNGHPYPGVVGYGSDGTLYYYPNPSGGALGARQQLGSGWQGLKLTMADFDNDRRQDVLATRTSGALMLYRSNGAGRFVSETRRQIGSGWNTIAQSHASFGFDGAGSRGLIAKVTDGRLIYYGLGTNKFLASRQVGTGWGPLNVFR
ncbi:D-alanyl-D-alanine carboxypeptidase [Arthrobacter crusticola]|uniref:D-alanyl-D-alanine carboxypeptidase n=1 Tax=Arthrobacter crusticola TaxID=2547960 RepID=A0A4V3AMR0_9MICC|nr:D-alanyl-D-alanine carboxypeptidase family protein [Arthrobacter crusticola]TDK25599.1 D-alanyl-D-alanine carboxypeptidase [Arthrobacter crusticola]